MKKESKNLLALAKKILKKETYRKLKNIEDENELEHAAKYILLTHLEREHHEIEKELKKLEQMKRDVFFAKNKALLIPSKIKHFKVEFNTKEFDKVERLIQSVKGEIKNVAV